MKKLMVCAFAAVLASLASAVVIPNNNWWESAEVLDSSIGEGCTRDESNSGATEPQGDPLCAMGDYGKTLWYRWTAPFDGIVQFSTEGSSLDVPLLFQRKPELDTVMCVFALDSQGVPQPAYLENGEMAFNDDADPNVVVTSLVGPQQVLAGETYYIGVGTKRGSSGYLVGSVRLNWSFAREMAVVQFHPQGGITTASSIRLLGDYPLKTFGDIEVPVRGGYDFIGWFTSPAGGLKITGEETYEQLKGYISDSGFIHLYAQWKLTGLVTPQFASFAKAQIFDGVFLGVDHSLVGIVQIKAGKVTSKNTSKLNVVVTRYDTLKRTSAKGTLTFNEDGSATSGDIAISFKDGGLAADVMRMTVNADGIFSMRGDHYYVEAAQVGGALTSSGLTFMIPSMRKSSIVYELPVAPTGFKVIEEALPSGFKFSTASNGQKFSFPSGTALSYKKSGGRNTPGRAVWALQGLGDSNPNKSQLKLTYSYKNGIFKGKFKVYVTNGENYISNGGTIELKTPKLQKYDVTVAGVVVSGRGFGMSTLKKTSQNWITVLNP